MVLFLASLIFVLVDFYSIKYIFIYIFLYTRYLLPILSTSLGQDLFRLSDNPSDYNMILFRNLYYRNLSAIKTGNWVGRKCWTRSAELVELREGEDGLRRTCNMAGLCRRRRRRMHDHSQLYGVCTYGYPLIIVALQHSTRHSPG